MGYAPTGPGQVSVCEWRPFYMGAHDVERQARQTCPHALLGPEVIPVSPGRGTLKERDDDRAARLGDQRGAIPLIASAQLPARTPIRECPRFPIDHRQEVREQMECRRKAVCPDTAIAAIGAVERDGLFYPFLVRQNVNIIGVEAGGKGVERKNWSHCAVADRARPGVPCTATRNLSVAG